MKRILPLAIIALFSMSFISDSAGPNIKFEKTTHDFGKIPQGKPASYEFLFTNTGDEPLILVNVKASCGCTTPYYPDHAIKPGETEKIKATYNASRAGSFTKAITVTTNMKKADGTEGKSFSLKITGNVVTADLNEKKEAPQSPVRNH